MAYESFYGGRKGESFVLVKRYNSIEEMTSEFMQGGITTDEVNYGEYVIIDTINKNSDFNGCVYRRELDYDTTVDNTNKYAPGAGARYIGQIIGPDGKVRSLRLTSYNNSELDSTAEYYGEGSWTVGADDLVPGYDKENNKYNDSINYKYISLVDEDGNIKEYLIGCQFPYTVFNFDGISISPYYDIDENLIERIDDKTHPFFNKFRIKIPKGVKGDSVSEISIYPTVVPEGTQFYLNPDGTGNVSQLLTDGVINVNDYNDEDSFIKFTYDDTQIGYANRNSINFNQCFHYRYSIINYDEVNPVTTYFDLSEYKVIDKVTGDLTGKINVYYASGGYDTFYIKALKNVYMSDEDYKIHVVYYEGTESLDTPIGEPIKFIDDAYIAVPSSSSGDDAHLFLKYNTEEEPVDLGRVKGDKGGISIIGRYSSVEELYRDPETKLDPYTPEDLKEGCEGQCVIVAASEQAEQVIYTFDYNIRRQTPLGKIGVSEPYYYINIRKVSDPDPEELLVDGIVLLTEDRKGV